MKAKAKIMYLILDTMPISELFIRFISLYDVNDGIMFNYVYPLKGKIYSKRFKVYTKNIISMTEININLINEKVAYQLLSRGFVFINEEISDTAQRTFTKGTLSTPQQTSRDIGTARNNTHIEEDELPEDDDEISEEEINRRQQVLNDIRKRAEQALSGV